MRFITFGRHASEAPGDPSKSVLVDSTALQSHPGPNLTPLIVALLALTALVAGPLVVSHRLARVRHELISTTARSRHLVHQAELQLLLNVASRREPALSRLLGERIPREGASYELLEALSVSPDSTVARNARRLSDVSAGWYVGRNQTGLGSNSERTREDATPAPATAGADDTARVMSMFAAAERLDSALAVREARESVQVQSLEALDMMLPTVLVPLLLCIVVAVYRVGRRMATLADDAERNRVALVRASEQKVALLRGLTHDLKNTLWAATGFAALLRDEIVGSLTLVQRDHVTRIGRLIDQAITAVSDTLEIARADAGTLRMSRRRVDLGRLLAECASDYGAKAESAGLVLGTDISSDLPAIETDPSYVSHVVGNLLSNAIKYTPRGGRVCLRATIRSTSGDTPSGPWIAVEVADTGPGVPAAFRQQIFEEFFRMPDAYAVAPGAGVGLAMSRRVARALGGEITMGAEDGFGAVCTLWLPLVAQVTNTVGIPDAATRPSSRPSVGYTQLMA
jgi:signal transduction histidine kinase